MGRVAACVALLLALAACATPSPSAPATGGAREPVPSSVPPSGAPPEGSARPRPRTAPPASTATVRLRSDRVHELSGLATSRRDDDVLWAIDDGGNAATLHAFARDGRSLGEWPVAARNRDWEDLAAFRLGGVPYLMIADTGDNLRRRDDDVLYVVVEPLVSGHAPEHTPLAPVLALRFRFEDGAHDVEAVAVDETSATVWMLTKEPPVAGKGVPGGVYALPLPIPLSTSLPTPPLSPPPSTTPDADALPIARRVATLAPVPATLTTRLAAALTGIDLEQPTALDMSADGRTACLLTYVRARCVRRADDEGWETALARAGRALPAHGLAQAEALALSADGLVRITSEGERPPMRTLRLPPSLLPPAPAPLPAPVTPPAGPA